MINMHDMKLNNCIILALSVVAMLMISACEKEEGENETNISTYNSDESHKSGENCMTCHTSGGPGEGWFTAAGTVYNSDQTTPYPNATIRLYTGNGGTGDLRGTIEVDGRGNFYTTESIDFSGGLYVSAEGDGGTKYMIAPISNGQCNSCHGTSTDRIWVQ